MLKQVKIGNWLLEVDREKTKEFYDKDVIDVCDCLYCNNFVEAIKHLDISVATFFRELGINPSMPAHSSDFPATEDGKWQYIGQYHLVGRVLEGKLCTMCDWDETNNFQIIKDFDVCFSEELEFVTEDFPIPVLQMNFDAHIPWVLHENPDSDFQKNYSLLQRIFQTLFRR
ncbi:hypothetical protein [Niallia sp. NCCP-28]|uniref:hypothetical protein n=1 Tax=Niallia sp. NCCP-28 TaxID=2934712 RepID=UPI002085CF89|nr:hypothetical protein [Niallia sp. NCCP-28]GKU80957.1 hypothetical protein NCCP28_03530 [Niallia sp. NCCP-28]